MVKAPKVHVVDMDELIEKLQPVIDAVKTAVKEQNMGPPFDFAIYPMLMASVLIDDCGDDLDMAKANYSTFGELLILGYLSMRQKAFGASDKIVDLKDWKAPKSGAH